MNLERLLLNIAYADACTRPFSGMSAGHVRSHFNSMDVYFNSEEANKDHPERWKKPGLYGWIFQTSLLSVYAGKNRLLKKHEIEDAVEESLGTIEQRMDSIRDGDPLVHEFLVPQKETDAVNLRPGCSPVFLSVLFSLACAPKKSSFEQVLSFLIRFTRNSDTAACALWWDALVRSLEYSSASLFENAGNELASLIKKMDILQPLCFNAGIHPDALEESFGHLQTIAGMYLDDQSTAAEKHIKYVDSLFKSPITRSTIDHPLLLPFHALRLAESHRQGSAHLLESAVKEGGEVQLASALACTLMPEDTAFDDDFAFLAEDLVNKKRLSAFIPRLLNRASMQELAEFFDAERKLSAKEDEERSAILKHAKKKQPKRQIPKDRASREEQLSRHVVESWTKKDRARYKREQRRNKARENEDE